MIHKVSSHFTMMQKPCKHSFLFFFSFLGKRLRSQSYKKKKELTKTIAEIRQEGNFLLSSKSG